jgi:transposase InsO family protein
VHGELLNSCGILSISRPRYNCAVRDLAVLFLHLLATVARLAGPGGARAVVAESVLVKHQLLILNRSRKRSPNLCPSDRVVAGLCALFMRRGRLIRSAIVFRPSTLLSLHRALIQRKYRRLFSSKRPIKPGPKGPSQEVTAAVVDMKQRNPSWGCPRIAQQITLAFGIRIDKDVVRRILAARYQPKPDSAGPSWLTVLGHAKDSLWSVDLFRCESAILRTYWVVVVMDQWTRRIVGFGVHRGIVDGVSLCQMFNRAIGRQPAPTYLSSDHDPLYRFHQWQANLRILDVEAIKTVPYVPLSHPFVERLIGTIRRECLDHTLFWTAADLDAKLCDFQHYFNGHRTHAALRGMTPEPRTGEESSRASVGNYRWRPHCRGLYQTPIAA